MELVQKPGQLTSFHVEIRDGEAHILANELLFNENS